MTRPSTLPTWNSGASNRTEPSAGAKVTGYTAGQKPTSGVLNWIFGLVGEWLAWLEDESADQVYVVSPLAATRDDGFWDANAGGYVVSNGPGTALLGVPVRTGDKIKSVTIGRYGDGMADLDVTIYKLTAAGVATVLNTGGVATTITNPAASWADTTIDIDDITLAAGEGIFIKLDSSETNIRVGSVRVTYDRP